MTSPHVFRPNTLVTWAPGMRPVSAPDLQGPVLSSKGRVTTVMIDGKPQLFATVTLAVVN